MKINLSLATKLLALLLILVVALTSCDLEGIFGGMLQPSQTTSETVTTKPSTTTTSNNGGSGDVADEFDFSLIPEYSEKTAPEGYVVVNNNVPFFEDFSDGIPECEEIYGELDALGRCTSAYAMLGKDLLPTDEKGSISSVRPTGWHSVSYPETSSQSLYNRTHLIAWALTGENANAKNLITGTMYMNQTVMQIFETQLLSYVKGNDTHVAYRVTPIFEGDNLLASGVLLEAKSYEDDGEDIMFCVYLYNVQPGIIINYATGESERDTSGDEGTGTDFDGTVYDFAGFASLGDQGSYKDRTGTDGWSATYVRLDPQAWIGAAVPQIILNGKTTAVGSLTSATLSGGVSVIHLNYGLSFSDTKISFTVEIIQNGKTVAQKTVTNDSAEKLVSYELEWTLEEAVEGDFIIKITNNCPSSNSSSNKDRLSIWYLGWK